MTAGQPLRGFVGQGMNGRRPKFRGYAYNFPPGTYTFRAPKAGNWQFAAWGAGKSNLAAPSGGDSGALGVITRLLAFNEAVTIVVGTGAADTVITFANGKVCTAGRATGIAGAGVGVATGFDVNISGNPGGVADGGPAPSYGTFLGGSGGVSGPGGAPGGGGSNGTADGGSAQVFAVYVRS